MEDGRFTLSIEPVDIQAEFEDTIYTYMELFKQDGIELHYNDSCDELFLFRAPHQDALDKRLPADGGSELFF